jgi:hypothetical protein
VINIYLNRISQLSAVSLCHIIVVRNRTLSFVIFWVLLSNFFPTGQQNRCLWFYNFPRDILRLGWAEELLRPWNSSSSSNNLVVKLN